MPPWAEPAQGPLRIPGMLMLGAAGRHAGKTELACALIARAGRGHEVVGVKVTTVHERGAACPRGKGRCGACDSFTGGWCITEEVALGTGKDTSRMREAGAARVLWLRVRFDCLAEGARALARTLPPGAVIVCESNSLRHAVEPDVFLVMQRDGDGTIKPSCAGVLRHADEIVRSDGTAFTPGPCDISFLDGRWQVRRRATAVVLAGGKSSRMGCDKAMLSIDGVPMITRIVRQLERSFAEVLVCGGARDYAFLGHRAIPDRVPGRGPLMALASALEASSHDLNLVAPCDVPDLPADLIARLVREARDADAAVPVTQDGHLEPLLAVYRKAMAPAARAALERGERKVVSMYGSCRIRRIPLDGGVELRNLNTMADYLACCAEADAADTNEGQAARRARRADCTTAKPEHSL